VKIHFVVKKEEERFIMKNGLKWSFSEESDSKDGYSRSKKEETIYNKEWLERETFESEEDCKDGNSMRRVQMSRNIKDKLSDRKKRKKKLRFKSEVRNVKKSCACRR